MPHVKYGGLLAGLLLIIAAAGENPSPIIFAEDFESGSLEAWDADSVTDDPERLRITSNPAHVYRGDHALEIIAQPGQESGAKLNKWFMPGHDRVYLRFYVKFDADFDQGNHLHLVQLLANRTDNRWSAFGTAGQRPAGDDFFVTGIEPIRDFGTYPPPGALIFYTYHMDMPPDPRSGRHWGEVFRPEPTLTLERDRWYGIEIMVQANTPGEADGEQALWVDGEHIVHFTGIRWRDSEDVKFNALWLMLYVHDSPQVNRVYFDEVVLSREYIGPLPPGNDDETIATR